LRGICTAVLWLFFGTAFAQPAALPSFAELEARGAVIGEIRVFTDNIFDRNDPDENNALFRAANALHIRTRPWLIERVLLFKSGQPVSKRVIEETERVIRQTTTVYEVSIRPVALRDNVVDIEVRTRDTWTLQPGLRFRREGGATSAALNIKESNLLGTGATIGLERNTSVDRTGTLAQISHDHLFDGWTSLALQRSTYDDGSASSVTLAHPFYALDTRWAAGAQASRFDRRDAVFEGGNAVGDYRHFNRAGEVFAGHSNGLRGRWTHRQSVGVNYTSDKYEIEPSRPPPIAPPSDRVLAGPFFRYEAVEDDFLPVMNRDLIHSPWVFTPRCRSGAASAPSVPPSSRGNSPPSSPRAFAPRAATSS
jgi:hypothetical protein